MKQYLKKHKSANINFKIDAKNRTPLHIASLLGDDGIIRVLVGNGADVALVDSAGDTPVHLAARWCSREENYPNYKLVMTPLFKANPKVAYAENKAGETPQMLLNLGKERALRADKEMREMEKAKEEKKEEQETNRDQPMGDWHEKLQIAAEDDDGDERNFNDFNKDWVKEEIKETWDDWADRIAKEYVHKRKAYEANWGKTKKTASGGLGIGKRGKEGRRNKKENERKEFLDHQKRRLDNYIKAQDAKKEEKKVQQKEDYTKKIEKMRKETSILRYSDIPWPCEGTVKDMVEIMLADAPLTDPAKYRKTIHRQQLIWHPDKFSQRTGERLDEKDKEKILLTVQHISQALNKALENCDLV